MRCSKESSKKIKIITAKNASSPFPNKPKSNTENNKGKYDISTDVFLYFPSLGLNCKLPRLPDSLRISTPLDLRLLINEFLL